MFDRFCMYLFFKQNINQACSKYFKQTFIDRLVNLKVNSLKSENASSKSSSESDFRWRYVNGRRLFEYFTLFTQL